MIDLAVPAPARTMSGPDGSHQIMAADPLAVPGDERFSEPSPVLSVVRVRIFS